MMASSTIRSVVKSSRMSRTSCSVDRLLLSSYFFLKGHHGSLPFGCSCHELSDIGAVHRSFDFLVLLEGVDPNGLRATHPSIVWERRQHRSDDPMCPGGAWPVPRENSYSCRSNSRRTRTQTKKADVVEHPRAFNHVGLLA